MGGGGMDSSRINQSNGKIMGGEADGHMEAKSLMGHSKVNQTGNLLD